MIAVASLIVLIAVIAFSAVTKKNAGVVGLVAAYIFSIAAAKCGTEINVSKVVTGNWPTSVFFIVLATTFLFGIATLNGTTQALSKNIVCLARGNAKILPVIFFLFGAIISAAGAGGCSCSIQSMVAAPSCTSPNLWLTPVKNRMRSVVVVLPASMWAEMPILR